MVLNPYIPTLGGGEKQMGYLCKFLEDRYPDADLDIVVYNYNNIDVNAKGYVTVDKINKQFGLDLRRTRIKKITQISSMDNKDRVKNKQYIEKLTRNYDLFINHMFMSKHIGCAKYNIYECMFPPKRFKKELSKLYYILGSWWDRRFYKSYDVFSVNSLYTDEWLKRIWSGKVKSHLVYPPVFSNNEIEGRYQEERKKNIIISVGRFFFASHCKKQLDLVKFFVSHKQVFADYQYHLVGALSNHPDDLNYFKKIKEVADSVDNVFLHENCEYDKLMTLYGEAKIFWHATGYMVDESKEPEKMEHFGITTVEAMSYGAVPVVINKGGQKETVEDGVNGYLWDTEDECIKKTKQLIDNDKLREKFALESVKRAKNYSIENFNLENERLFNELEI